MAARQHTIQHETFSNRFGPDLCQRQRPLPPASRKMPSETPRVRAKWLGALAEAIGAECATEALITGIASDSRRVRPGDLFVAATGDRAHLGDFIADAIGRGAAGIVAPEAVEDFPSIAIPDPRAALPQLAAAFYDHPAEELLLIGISGTLGKTSTTLLLGDILEAARLPVGVVGSLGIKLAEATRETGVTTPDASVLQGALRWFVDQGVGHVAMEVTSHALSQRRVDGLGFGLGLLTNLVPDEHLEYHPTPEHYLETKMRFLDFLDRQAPLVINADCAISRARTRHLGQAIIGVSCRGEPGAAVQVEDIRIRDGASEFLLRGVREAPGLELAPGFEMALRLPLIGVTQVANAAMAATAALLLGVAPGAIRRGLASARPIHRRMEVIRPSFPVVIDDTVGNPRSLQAVFDTIRHFPSPGALRVLFGIRGMRGQEINARLGETLARCLEDTGAELVVTSSEDVADDRNRVQPAERDAFIRAFEGAQGGPMIYEPSLEKAVDRLVGEVGEEDIVLLLGAQGLDSAAGMVLEHLR